MQKHSTRKHPKREIYTYPFLSKGFEAALYKVKEKNVVHKFWRQDWILANYPMFASGKRAFKQASRRAAKRFSSSHDALLKEDYSAPHHGIPIEKFKMITFIMSKTTEDIIKQAGKAGIPVPPVARTVRHPKKDLYIVELSDLSKPGRTIFSGNEFVRNPGIKPEIKGRIVELMNNDAEKLFEMGYEQDIETHPVYSAWLVRVDKKTGKAERFLWDPTNLRIVPRASQIRHRKPSPNPSKH